MNVLVYDPYVNSFKQIQAKNVSLDKLLKESDFISVHCAVTEETTNLLNYKEFNMMK